MHSTTIRRQLKRLQHSLEMQRRSLDALTECPIRTEEERDADLHREAEELMREFINEEF